MVCGRLDLLDVPIMLLFDMLPRDLLSNSVLQQYVNIIVVEDTNPNASRQPSCLL